MNRDGYSRRQFAFNYGKYCRTPAVHCRYIPFRILLTRNNNIGQHCRTKLISGQTLGTNGICSYRTIQLSTCFPARLWKMKTIYIYISVNYIDISNGDTKPRFIRTFVWDSADKEGGIEGKKFGRRHELKFGRAFGLCRADSF